MLMTFTKLRSASSSFRGRRHLLGLLLALPMAVTLGARPAQAQEPDAAVSRMMKTVLEATKNKDYDAFVVPGNDEVRAQITRQMFEGVANQVAPRMKQGYKTVYLTRLRQAGHMVYLWKIEFSDGKDEHLFRLAVKDGKMAGVLLQ